jgi:hypothetical protein
MPIVNAVLNNAAVVEVPFTVPAGQTWAITTIMVCNNIGASRSFSLYAVMNGDPHGNKNRIVNTAQVDAADTFVMDSEKLILEADDKLVFEQSGGSVADLSATVSYIIV